MGRFWPRRSGDGKSAGARGRRVADRVEDMDPAVRAEVVAFLRGWLPERAKAVYRTMVAEDPEGWRAHPHFAGDLIVEHALRGNGITAEGLGVTCLKRIWPELLELALNAEETEREAETPRLQ
jgi:hypothetical protein